MGYLLLLNIILVVLLRFASAETYYIKPAPSSSCPKEVGVLCLTFSQYATNQSRYVSTKIPCVLLPGNHSLEMNLQFSNAMKITICSQVPANPTKVSTTCNQSAMFSLYINVTITGLVFNGCVNNTVISRTV